MITRHEIEAVSGRMDVHTSNVQRDYVHGWLLSILYSASPLANKLILKGGNCLRKGYFPDARYSRDLDFTSSDRLDHDDLGRELNAICAKLEQCTGVHFLTERTRVEDKQRADAAKTISEARLYFRDFYGVESTLTLAIRLDVTQFDRLYLPDQQRLLIHPYSDADACTARIRCVKLEELLATKMRCLLQRRHIADLFDLAYATFLDNEQEVNKGEILSTFFKITIFGRSQGVAKGLFIDLPLEALGRLWDTYISCPKSSRFSFAKAKEHFLAFVDALIPVQPIREQSSVFFSSLLRMPIMEAGETLTLLRLDYHRKVRLVEPYSLQYMRRKDGIAREYLCAYDTTGGNSKPGIKLFVPGEVQSVENTTVQFEPRYEVELRKAGGAETAGAFLAQTRTRKVSPFRALGIKRPSTKRVSGFQTPYHEIQCHYCLRRFKRANYSTSLKPHKDRQGNPCFGRSGYRV